MADRPEARPREPVGPEPDAVWRDVVSRRQPEVGSPTPSRAARSQAVLARILRSTLREIAEGIRSGGCALQVNQVFQTRLAH
jgi:hypothetical protein